MRPAERLLARLRELGLDLPEGTTLHRTYAGEAMRKNGAWSWFAIGPDGEDLRLGSRRSMAELLAAETLIAQPDSSGSYREPDMYITTPEWMD